MAHISRRNPLALMVLCTLWEMPTHPYQLVQTLKGRQKDKAARLNYGSLYTVIANLENAGLVEAVEVTKAGNLPPRTTYRVTDAGITELNDWLSSLIADPEPEIPQFMTALSILPALPVDQAVTLLGRRVEALRQTLNMMSVHRDASQAAIPELFSIESRYAAVMTRAELEFTLQLIKEIEDGSLGGIDIWQAMQQTLRDGRPDQGAMAAAFERAGFGAVAGMYRQDEPSPGAPTGN